MQTMIFHLFNLLDVGPALCHVLFRWNLPETSDDDMNDARCRESSGEGRRGGAAGRSREGLALKGGEREGTFLEEGRKMVAI